MKNKVLQNAEIKERVMKGLDLAFEKLLKAKQQTNGSFVFSENGIIKKVKASELIR